VIRKFSSKGFDSLSIQQPSDGRTYGGACRKRDRNSESNVSLETASCLIQELFGSIAPLFCGMPYYSQAIVYRIDNSAGRASSLVGCFGDALSRSIYDCL
jgi:hypothetical protein